MNANVGDCGLRVGMHVAIVTLVEEAVTSVAQSPSGEAKAADADHHAMNGLTRYG
jgi:hypothetical protein